MIRFLAVGAHPVIDFRPPGALLRAPEEAISAGPRASTGRRNAIRRWISREVFDALAAVERYAAPATGVLAAAWRPRRLAAFYGGHTLFFVAFLLLFYVAFPRFLLQNHDGQNLYYTASMLERWRTSPLETFTFSPLSGMGSRFWPLNPTFIPFLWIFDVARGPTVRVYVLAVTAGFSIFAAALLFFASLRLRPALAVTAAWLTFVLVMLQTIDFMTGTDPLQSIVMAYVALAVFVEVGRHRPLVDVALLVLFALVSAAMILAHPGWHIVALPLLVTVAGTLLVMAEGWRERVVKMLAIVVALAPQLWLQTYTALWYAYADTARVALASRFVDYPHIPYLAGHLFRNSVSELVFGALVLIGLMTVRLDRLSDRPRVARAVTVATIVFYAGAMVGGLWFLYFRYRWPGPKPSYIGLYAYPLAALFAVAATRRLHELLRPRRDVSTVMLVKEAARAAPSLTVLLAAYALCHVAIDWTVALVIVALAAAAAGVHALVRRRLPTVAAIAVGLAVLGVLGGNVQRSFGPSNTSDRFLSRKRMGLVPNPVVRFVAARVALQPGTSFRGYADDAYGRLPFPTLDAELVYQWGSNWRWYRSGMKVFSWSINDIPTVSEYSPYIKPLYFAFFTALLNEPGDRHVVNYLTITKPDRRILSLMGVRFLVSDGRPLPSFGAPVFTWQKFQVFELPDANVASYSPTRSVVVRSARDTLRLIGDERFDPREQVVITAGVGSDLVRARRAALEMRRGGYVVTADSDGRSLVVLPVQFSHCFLPRIVSGDGEARLIRVNLVQTGLLFRGGVTLEARFRHWPLVSPACQQADFEEARSLGIDALNFRLDALNS